MAIKNVVGGPAEDLLKKSNTFVLDVRTKEEFATGALPGAVLIPIDQLQNNTDKFPPDKQTPILIYCAHGVRSLFGASFLERTGFTNVYNLQGGIAAHQFEISKRK